jgi:hypothetical protein
MYSLRRPIAVLLAAVAIVAALGDASAAAATKQVGLLRLTVGGLTNDAKFSLDYGSAFQGLSGQATVLTGTLEAVDFNRDGFKLTAFGPDPLSGTFDLQIEIGSATKLTGIATVPPGAGGFLDNLLTGTRIFIKKSGPFSIDAGVSKVAARPPNGGNQTIDCAGNAGSCGATVPLAGGARNRKLTIKLTDTNLRLLSVAAFPRSSDGAYLLTAGHLSRGGSEYIVTLNAAKANPKGSHLVLKFGTA